MFLPAGGGTYSRRGRVHLLTDEELGDLAKKLREAAERLQPAEIRFRDEVLPLRERREQEEKMLRELWGDLLDAVSSLNLAVCTLEQIRLLRRMSGTAQEARV